MADSEAKPAVIEPPRGFHATHVDEKGRLKLTSAFKQLFTDWGEQKVFVTTLDSLTARVYTNSAWKQTEKFLEEAREDSPAAEDVYFLANHYGGDAELDAQGRVLMPPVLRRDLGMENQQVWLQYYKGRINVYSKSEYDRRLQQSLESASEKLRSLEKKGLR